MEKNTGVTSARTDLRFITDANIGAESNNNPDTIEPGYQLLSARLGLTTPDERFQVALFGDNLTETGYCGFRVPQSGESLLAVRNAATGASAIRCVTGGPRRYGVQLRMTLR